MFVSNKTLYHSPISHQLAVHIEIKISKPSYVIWNVRNENEFRCISKSCSDLFEKLVFELFNNQRRGRNDYKTSKTKKFGMSLVFTP
jgi:hypothetical protein